MPKNTKRMKNKGRSTKTTGLRYKNEGSNIGEEYARVIMPRGNCRFQVQLLNGNMFDVELAGRLKKRCKINCDDLVLIEPTDDGTRGHWRIIVRYTNDEEKTLKKEGHLMVETDTKAEEKAFVFEGEEEENGNDVVDIDEDFIDFI